ncbi:MAG: hypothetical protein GKR88_11215 [Flavobacteriaceae bacterium]|nr:MAG: hypothetical protein GKR88_11215 [Flavobacteriaceae bacterium]
MEHLTIQTFLVSFLGATGQEVLHWYNLRLELDDSIVLDKSKTYWLIVFISTVFFGLTTIYIDDFIILNVNLGDHAKLFITALFYPIVIKKILQVVTKTIQRSREGNITTKTGNQNFTLTTYFK